MQLPTLTEDDTYYFDEAAADRPVRFIERFCRHYEGRFAGEPFLLHDVQKRIVRDVFGWKVRATGLRRFTDVYFEAAVGAGKSPLFAAIGLYGLMADGERGAQVYSLASNYGQARVVFDTAKRFALQNPALSARLEVMQFEIRHPASASFWRIVSGKGPGAGCRPSMILEDEVHEWPNGGGHQALRDRMGKRTQPVLLSATNAGQSRASFCYALRAKAVAALELRGDATLYPIIWHAPEDAEPDDPAAWAAANPLIGTTIRADKVAQLAREAIESPDPADLTNFRRLYLGHWPTTGAGRWLDLALWDAAAAAVLPDVADAPLYTAFDLAQSDDLCAAVYVYPLPDRRFVVDAEFWLPRATAEKYVASDAIPYDEWAAAGHIHLIDEPTISSKVRRDIAAAVLARGAGREVRAVCYDRYKADETVAVLEGRGLTCVPVPQGWSVSSGCHELERRLAEPSIVLTANPVLRWCAENCEVKGDDRGNIWPVKPNARGRYAGERAKKIDGISALVTCLTEARKHSFPAAQQEWRGSVCSV